MVSCVVFVYYPALAVLQDRLFSSAFALPGVSTSYVYVGMYVLDIISVLY